MLFSMFLSKSNLPLNIIVGFGGDIIIIIIISPESGTLLPALAIYLI